MGVFRQRDENVQDPIIAQKSLYHQRNKSMSALNSVALSLKPTTFAQPIRRAAFADISNIRNDAKDTGKSSIGDAKGSKAPEKDTVKAPLKLNVLSEISQPSNNVVRAGLRPLSINKALPAEPVSSQIFAHPSKHTSDYAYPRKTLVKRHTTIFTDTSYGSTSPAEYAEPKPAAPMSIKLVEQALVPITRQTVSQPTVPELFHEQLQQHEAEPAPANVLAPLPSITTLPIASQMEQKPIVPASILPVPALLNIPSELLSKPFEPILVENNEPELFLPALESQPIIEPELAPAPSEARLVHPAHDVEEYWDEDEEYYDAEGYVTARSIRSIAGENTTGGMSIVLVPRVTARVERELAAAKAWIDENVPIEDIDDECWDTTMVAEYSEEIFAYLKDLEVSFELARHD
jgi:G2/mitotic-specific cyclin 3/4